MTHWRHLWLMEQRFALVLVLLFTYDEIHGCATVPRKDPFSPIEQLLAAVNEAESQMEDDAIILPRTPAGPVHVVVPKGLTVFEYSFPVKPVKPVESAHEVPEVPQGTMVNFSCSQPQSTHQINATTVLWRHHSTDIYTNAPVPVSSASFFYSYSSVAEQSILFVHNVSLNAAGPVQCLHRCDTGWCVVHEFQLRPQPRAKDVFIGRLQNASSQCGGPISHTCRVHMNCTPGTVELKDKHYVWKLDEWFVGSPWEHSYLEELHLYHGIMHFLQRRKLHASGVAFTKIAASCARSGETSTGIYEEVLTITPEKTWSWCPTPSPHRVQCWSRPNNTGRRWLVQAAYAHY